jgi:translation initiation factor eIF-2B subunit delta
MAHRLAAHGVPVELFTDAALMASVSEADLVLLGCDALFPNRFVNKAGTHALLRMTRTARVPAFVIADSFKFLPISMKSSFQIREENPAEVWSRKHRYLRIRNSYFEEIPIRLVSGVVTELGLREAKDIPLLMRRDGIRRSATHSQKRRRKYHARMINSR